MVSLTYNTNGIVGPAGSNGVDGINTTNQDWNAITNKPFLVTNADWIHSGITGTPISVIGFGNDGLPTDFDPGQWVQGNSPDYTNVRARAESAASTNDLLDHTTNADIHVSTSDRARWDNSTNKATLADVAAAGYSTNTVQNNGAATLSSIYISGTNEVNSDILYVTAGAGGNPDAWGTYVGDNGTNAHGWTYHKGARGIQAPASQWYAQNSDPNYWDGTGGAASGTVYAAYGTNVYPGFILVNHFGLNGSNLIPGSVGSDAINPTAWASKLSITGSGTGLTGITASQVGAYPNANGVAVSNLANSAYNIATSAYPNASGTAGSNLAYRVSTQLFSGANSTGLVTSATSDTNKFMCGNGTWRMFDHVKAKTTGQTVTNTVWTKVLWTEIQDDGNIFTTSRVTPTKSGWVHVSATFCYGAPPTGYYYADIYRNNGAIAGEEYLEYVDAGSAGYALFLTCSWTDYCTSGDYYEIQTYQSSAAPQALQANTGWMNFDEIP